MKSLMVIIHCFRRARPGDTPAEHTLSLKEIARKLVPPICVDAIRWLRRRD